VKPDCEGGEGARKRGFPRRLMPVPNRKRNVPRYEHKRNQLPKKVVYLEKKREKIEKTPPKGAEACDRVTHCTQKKGKASLRSLLQTSVCSHSPTERTKEDTGSKNKSLYNEIHRPAKPYTPCSQFRKPGDEWEGSWKNRMAARPGGSKDPFREDEPCREGRGKEHGGRGVLAVEGQ